MTSIRVSESTVDVSDGRNVTEEPYSTVEQLKDHIFFYWGDERVDVIAEMLGVQAVTVRKYAGLMGLDPEAYWKQRNQDIREAVDQLGLNQAAIEFGLSRRSIEREIAKKR